MRARWREIFVGRVGDRDASPAAGRAPLVLRVAAVFVAGALGGAWLTGRGSDGASALPAVSTGAGPARVLDGVPVGYTRSPAGAAAAATAFLGVSADLIARTDPAREAALRRMAAVHSAPALLEELREAVAPIDVALHQAAGRGGGGRVFVRSLPVAYAVEEFSSTRARLKVWGLSVFVLEGVSAAEEHWETADVELVWSGGDWRLKGWSTQPGPQPGTRSPDATPTAEFLSALEGLEGYSNVPTPSS